MLYSNWLHNPNILFLDEPTIGLDVWVKLYIKFDADILELETVVKYAFGTLKAVDMQISEINIEDVVKDIMASKAKGEVA